MNDQIEGKATTRRLFTCFDEQNADVSEDQILIGIDFGTTFSGIAFACLSDEDPKVIVVKSWPGMAMNQVKVPTIISYGSYNEKFSWRSQASDDYSIHGIKLLLDPNQDMPSYIPESTLKSNLKHCGKPAVDVAADFLQAMYKYALERLELEFPLEYVKICEKKLILSVPAVWSDKAKDLTLQAARQAGLHPVALVKEPEAAAFHTLNRLKNKGVAVGNAIVICDAGGGTVDLISYEVVQLVPKLELKELVPGTGCMAGSLNLNNRWEEMVKDIVGEDDFYRIKGDKCYLGPLDYFEQVAKRQFRGVERKWVFHFFKANLRDNRPKGLFSDTLVLNCKDMKAIFDPIIADIKDKVNEQVQAVMAKRLSDPHEGKPKAILLVGGFGSSEYLRSELAQQFPTIQVMQPNESWSAIVQGAVLSQLPQKVTVVSRQATRHYGVSAGFIYDAAKDEGHPKYMDAYGKWRTRRMTWYIRRGDTLGHSHKIRFPFYRTLQDLSDESLQFLVSLKQCELIEAPDHPDSTVEANCQLVVDLRNVERDTFQKKRGMYGDWCWDVHYDLVVISMPAIMKFSLEHRGKEMGSVKAKY
ncbi:4da1ac85-6fa7-4ad0-9ca3-7b273f1d7897 [Sclerotinia trifoliorum]|uniref:4da1ac85-6fa7-4ad0-9ca3-7b273f1d7897 n=1 Tax=Sclerotinia trifoliorum TaxID=28548 RepID=A0A8H2ZLK9_9HELO|nr:4da1ac85-6fa7-4ad0-9ca3-7b273f1d7897 [Sclerotinia trifoliorum]